MILAVVGSRSACDPAAVYCYLLERDPAPSAIVSGGARGVDTYAAAWAKEKGVPLIEILPDYKKYGRGAPLLRNEQIVNRCDALVAFWDGKSRGTADAIARAKKKNKPVAIMYL
jgi:hypothetical protein